MHSSSTVYIVGTLKLGSEEVGAVLALTVLGLLFCLSEGVINDAETWQYQKLRVPHMHGGQGTLHGHLVCGSFVDLPSFRLQKWHEVCGRFLLKCFWPPNMISVGQAVRVSHYLIIFYSAVFLALSVLYIFGNGWSAGTN